ncbi:TIGR03084 family metal-binding protein [Mycobacteroides immunogenum]|uniref:TIGR03084 family metal-binding protein n=1 Tax=Mycobacteroides immunogenum TaxID=83262 RepID=UPI0025B77BE8|nr:TIGR03084 family metal-binding protein [Mycobacteroides immunogenum]WJR32690.1 TIGR03084 family metal-binding protein [Mycobacteroides immunogenum]
MATASDLDAVLSDLQMETEDLKALITPMTSDQWALPTPAVGWNIAHQIAHLEAGDHGVLLSIRAPDAFAEYVAEALVDPIGVIERQTADAANRPTEQLLAKWLAQHAELAEALRAYPVGQKIPWFGPPMSPTSMATARLMETWAHGRDVADALGVRRPAGWGLRHIANLGYRTRDFAFLINNLAPPTEAFRVEITAPDGDLWAWGPEDATQRVAGAAEDFCLLVTQRAHRDDLDVTAEGDDALRWLGIAQAFAGPPGVGRRALRANQS